VSAELWRLFHVLKLVSRLSRKGLI